MWQQLLARLEKGDVQALARAISFVENEQPGYRELLGSLKPAHAHVIGITGPPGAGKSTLTDKLIGAYVNADNKVAVLCVDPSSPFNLGAVLGDRIRMNEWYTHENVFIRSLATRGSMGGLHPKIIEITEMVKAACFTKIIVETVGVGQSEIEIAGLADTTVVVTVPEGGDEVQTMKSGLMEIADIFVVNKSDRADADVFVKNLRLMLAPAFHSHKFEIPIIKTVASNGDGVAELVEKINEHGSHVKENDKKFWLLSERAWWLIQQQRMQGLSREKIERLIREQGKDFNLYAFVQRFIQSNNI